MAAYREAVDSDTALLLTPLRGKAAQFNYILHGEHIELRGIMGLPVPSLSIYGGKFATIHEKIVAREDIPNKNISAGALGVITEIFSSGGEQRNICIDLTVAISQFDTAGIVELSAADCAKIDFGYALPLELDRWSAVAHRVLVLEHSPEVDVEQFRSQILRTTKSFHFIGISTKGSTQDELLS